MSAERQDVVGGGGAAVPAWASPHLQQQPPPLDGSHIELIAAPVAPPPSDEPDTAVCAGRELFVETRTWQAELREQANSAAPLCLFSFLQFAIGTISIALVGRTDDAISMAAAALGGSFSNVVGMSFLFGSSMPLETLCSQAHGAGQYRQIGVNLQRCLLANVVVAALVSLVWANSGVLFRLMGQDPTLSELAGRFTTALIPAAWFMGFQFAVQKALQAQGVMRPFGLVGLILVTCHTAIAWSLIHKHGYIGAATSVCITDALALFLTTAVYVRHERSLPPDKKTWPGVAGLRDAARDWAPFVRLAVPSTLMVVVEWSTFEVMTLLSGLLPGASTGAPTAASAVCFQLIMIFFALPLGLANAVSARVGGALGARRAEAARFAATVGFSATIAMEVCVAFSLLVVGGGRFAELFAGSGEEGAPTRAAFKAVLPALVVLIYGDGTQAVLSGVVRGAGLQPSAARLNLLSYYVLGLPLGALLAFGFKLGLVGLWVGLAFATNFQTAALGVLLSRLDWDAQAVKAAADAAAAAEAAIAAAQRNAVHDASRWKGKGMHEAEEGRALL